MCRFIAYRGPPGGPNAEVGRGDASTEADLCITDGEVAVEAIDLPA